MSGIVTFRGLQQMGKLGNQLFQMAGTIGYAMDHNKGFVFPRWSYQKYMPVSIGEIPEPVTEISEDSLRYTLLPFKEGNVNIHGHLFSTKYFKKYRNFILDYFNLLPEWHSYINNKYGQLLSGNTCALHVRRGDYLLPEQLADQGCMTTPYYLKAEGMMRTGHNRKFVVCSDDIAWCKETFKGSEFHFIEGENEIIDMFIMSKCRDNIIANSTFGWWSAWLNRNENKQVIAPRQWFANTEGWPDLYGDGWTVI